MGGWNRFTRRRNATEIGMNLIRDSHSDSADTSECVANVVSVSSDVVIIKYQSKSISDEEYIEQTC